MTAQLKPHEPLLFVKADQTEAGDLAGWLAMLIAEVQVADRTKLGSVSLAIEPVAADVALSPAVRNAAQCLAASVRESVLPDFGFPIGGRLWRWHGWLSRGLATAARRRLSTALDSSQ